MIGKEVRDIPRILDIWVPDNMVPVIVMKTIMQRVLIDSYAQQNKKTEYTAIYYKLSLTHHLC